MNKRKYKRLTAEVKAKTDYGKLIVEKIEKAGMTVMGVERLLGYRERKLYEMINGKTNINPKDAESLGNLLGDISLKDKILLMQSEYQKAMFMKQFKKQK